MVLRVGVSEVFVVRPTVVEGFVSTLRIGLLVVRGFV